MTDGTTTTSTTPTLLPRCRWCGLIGEDGCRHTRTIGAIARSLSVRVSPCGTAIVETMPTLTLRVSRQTGLLLR